MKVKIKVLDKEFELKSKLKNSGVPFPNSEKDTVHTVHNKFIITVKRILDNQSIAKRFYFYDSMANYQEGKIDLDGNSLKWAFRCIIEDGLSGNTDFEDFCSNFGYSTDSIRAERIYKLCQKTLYKLLDLGLFVSELEDVINEILEIKTICDSCEKEDIHLSQVKENWLCSECKENSIVCEYCNDILGFAYDDITDNWGRLDYPSLELPEEQTNLIFCSIQHLTYWLIQNNYINTEELSTPIGA